LSKKRIRTIGSFTYAANQSQSLDLPKEFVMSKLFLELSGSTTVSATGTVLDDNPQTLLRRIEINRDGLAPIVWDGAGLMAYNYLMNGILPAQTALDVTGTGAKTFRAFMELPFELQRSGEPWRTYLPTQNANTLQLKVTWGSDSHLHTSATCADFAAALNVLSEELMNRPDAIAPGGAFDELIVGKVVETFSSATANGRIKLPREYPYRGLLIRAAGTANDGRSLSDAVINSIKVKERLTLETFDFTWDQLRQLNELNYSLANDFGTPTSPFNCEGYAFIDFIKMGFNDLVDPRSFTEFDLILDVEASTHITVYPIQVKPAVTR